MNRDAQHDPEHVELLQRLKDSFSSVYMTVLSIIQGVALGDLASTVGNNYARFALVHWLLVLATLGIIVDVWHQIMMDAISLKWIPDFRDTAILFGLGILELALNHLIPLSLSLWLFLMAVTICTLVVESTVFASRRAEQGIKNRRVLNLLRRRGGPYLLHGISGIALFMLLGLLSSVGGLSAAAGVHGIRGLLAVITGLLAIAWVVSLFFNTNRYWHWIRFYAVTGQLPDS